MYFTKTAYLVLMYNGVLLAFCRRNSQNKAPGLDPVVSKGDVMPLVWLLAMAVLILVYHVRETAREQGREDERKKRKKEDSWPK